jgi:CheY-like chemotaxis protein
MDGFALVEEIRRFGNPGDPAIMMLSSATFHNDVKRCKEIGIGSYLTKPVRSAELLDAIGRLLGRAEMERRQLRLHARPADGVAMNKAVSGRRILLAEDNPVNQSLAVALLTKRGATVTVAGNGREAVEACVGGGFDIVLMDMQMPELDGLEATREIRQRETARGLSRTPIIALTAHAMNEDRDLCLAAGMDSFVSKPIRHAELFAAIERVTTREVSRT